MDQLAFANAKNVQTVSSFGSGTWRVSGTFFFSPDLRWFPFDYQTLEIDVEQLETPLWLWRFVPDYNLNGLSPSVNFPGWQASLRESSTSSTAQCEARAGTKVYPGASLDNMASASNVTYSNFIYRLKVQRPVWQGFLTHFVPPMFMLAPTQYSFFLDPLTVDAMTPLSLCSGALVSLVLFHSGIARTLPPMDYLTAFDKYILCVYTCDFAALCFSIAVILSFRRDREAAQERTKLRERRLDRQAADGEAEGGAGVDEGPGVLRKTARHGTEGDLDRELDFDTRLRAELRLVSLQTGISILVTNFLVVLPLWIAVPGFPMTPAAVFYGIAATLTLRWRWRHARTKAAQHYHAARGASHSATRRHDHELSLLENADREASVTERA